MNHYVTILDESQHSEVSAEDEPPSWIDACYNTVAVSKALGSRPLAFTILYLNSAAAQNLNLQFRHKDYPTNVLSFPAELPSFIISLEDGFTLGDIVICPEVVASEASAQLKSFHSHLSHLQLHGLLHLLGFDHQCETDASLMEALETKILATASIKNPYSYLTSDANFLKTSSRQKV